MPRWIYIPTSQHSAGIINILIILPNLLQGLFIVGAAYTPQHVLHRSRATLKLVPITRRKVEALRE